MTIADAPPALQYVILGFFTIVLFVALALILTLYFGYRRRK